MRRVLGGVAAAVLLLTAVPALAATDAEPEPAPEPVLLAECTLPADTVRLTAEGFSGAIATPAAFTGNEIESISFVLDLAGLPEGSTADVDAAMTWGVPANDYDLAMTAPRSGGTSENFQPFDPAEEQVGATKQAHCARITVDAIDFLAPVVVDELALALDVRTTSP